MGRLTRRHSPCSICGLDTPLRGGWFLVVENRWLDVLKIFSWHPSLALKKDVRTACCRQHLRTLLTQWLNQASLRLPPAGGRCMPIAGQTARYDADLDAQSSGWLVGELSVQRESFSRVWTGSPATLECILDALNSPGNGGYTSETEFQLLTPLPESCHGLAFH